MRSLLSRIFQFANRDLLVRDVHLSVNHPELGPVTYLGQRGKGGDWEIKRTDPIGGRAFDVVVEGDESGLSAPAVQRVLRLPAELDAIFARCEPELGATYRELTKDPLPSSWRDGFLIDAIALDSDTTDPTMLEVTYFVPATRRYFTVALTRKGVGSVQVDG